VRISPVRLDTSVPMGCCQDTSLYPDCANLASKTDQQIKESIFTEGCFQKYDDLVHGESTWMIIGAVAMALVQLACVVIACGIGKNAAQSHRYA